jgi:short-subunit dehydrogenase
MGHNLILVARTTDRLMALKHHFTEAHSLDVEIIVADLATDDGVASVVERIANGPPIDMLVNCAGYASRGAIADIDFNALQNMLKVNIDALARLSIVMMNRMKTAGRGTIINVGSGTAFMQLPGNAGYGASKSFVMAFTRHMQMEAHETGVRVQLLIPGVIATDFHRVAGNDLSQFPTDRIMSADDLVVASLRALEMGELVCIPSLPEIKEWEAYAAAERTVAGSVSRSHTAQRYHEVR